MRQSSLQGSLLEMFTDLLSKIFRVENKQVLVLNVLDCLDTRDLIDVFYTVLKRPSPSPDKLNGLLALHSSLVWTFFPLLFFSLNGFETLEGNATIILFVLVLYCIVFILWNSNEHISRQIEWKEITLT